MKRLLERMTQENKKKLLFSLSLCFFSSSNASHFICFLSLHLLHFMFHTLYESLLLFLFAVLSISPRTPTRSDIDCYARRIAPYTVTSRCKSFIENVEVFLREACIILEFGCGLCSCLGAGPAATVLLLFCSSSLLF